MIVLRSISLVGCLIKHQVLDWNWRVWCFRLIFLEMFNKTSAKNISTLNTEMNINVIINSCGDV